jgi:hypothetical protein
MRNSTLVSMFLALILSALLLGCKQVGMAGFASSALVPETPVQGWAKVYFYRNYEPYALMQAPIYVHLGEEPVGRVMPGTFISVEVPPGRHHFWAARAEKDYVNFEAKPGEIYFVRLSTRHGILIPQPVMIPTMPEMAVSRIKTLQRVE